jgi:hypothetical protein
MTDYKINQVGKAVVEKKSLRCDFVIEYEQFIEKFAAELNELSSPEVSILERAISAKRETKMDSKMKMDFEHFFSRISSQ